MCFSGGLALKQISALAGACLTANPAKKLNFKKAAAGYACRSRVNTVRCRAL